MKVEQPLTDLCGHRIEVAQEIVVVVLTTSPGRYLWTSCCKLVMLHCQKLCHILFDKDNNGTVFYAELADGPPTLYCPPGSRSSISGHCNSVSQGLELSLPGIATQSPGDCNLVSRDCNSVSGDCNSVSWGLQLSLPGIAT